MECNLVVVGHPGVGKSCLTIRFVTNHFLEEYDPSIEDSYRKRASIDDESCLLDVLDTAPLDQEEYSYRRDRAFTKGQGFVCVYDITSRESFDEVRDHYYGTPWWWATSAKADMNVQECFFAAVREIRRLNNNDNKSANANDAVSKGGKAQHCCLS